MVRTIMMIADPPDLEGYDFIRTLGSGGTATVFLYRQRVPNRQVAIKVGNRPITDAGVRRRFHDEADFMARLSEHPFIVTIYNAGITADGRGYMVLEYASAGSYRDLMKRRQLSVDEVLSCGINVASALYAAHKQGIIHRDLKPGNILISAQGLPLLADFGISATIYATGVMGFSIPWAPPEVLTGRSSGSETADIYSLAATLFALLVGRSPFEYGYEVHDRDELARTIVHGELPHIRRPDVPKGFEDVLRKAMAKDPDDRYYSALEFARDMQRVQLREYGHQTPVTVEDVPQYPQDRAGQRGRGDAARRSDGMGGRSVRAGALPQTAPERHGRRRVIVAAGVVAAAIAAVALFVTLVLPNVDAVSGGRSATVGDDLSSLGGPSSSSGDDSTGSSGGDASSGDANGESVPSPTDLTGSYDGTSVTFTWTNPDPRAGDRYSWTRITGDAGRQEANATLTDSTTLRLDDVTDDQTCIQVSIVRENRRMSQSPATACAVRR
ncbi:serine/threonine-protein kinase [Bifidobacterium callimiconis]|nr:serine/threonine-protein kinase [Bifidobacterium callimiconis]